MKRRNKRIVPKSITNRTSKVSTEQLLLWLDTTAMGTSMSLESWRKGGDAGEVDLALDALNAIWEELKKRLLTV